MNQTTDTTIARGATEGRRAVERDETTDLISSDRVDGTAVYSTDGEKLGHIAHLMIGKRSGKVNYAVMSFGGFLGLGESYHPIPWDALDYDTGKDGYVVNIDKEKLHDAPYYTRDAVPVFDANFGNGLYRYYGVFY
ncbi:MAG TPA: PRC-barrel domain-containing protein [Sphingomonadaceae bacterium]|nr:PRC-barrel domain-containing protein [Sphingomonadaceae bacterium]